MVAKLETEPLPLRTMDGDESQEKTSWLEEVRQRGGANSAALLDPKTIVFSPPRNLGSIGYRRTPSCAVAIGDPLCSLEQRLPLIQAFQRHCKEEKLNALFVTISQEFATWAHDVLAFPSIEVGAEVILDPQSDPKKIANEHGGLVRRKVKHALKEGIVITEYLGDDNADAKLEGALEEAAGRWLSMRKGPQLFLSHIRLFDDRPGKRWFYAKKDDEIMGLVLLHELKAKKGWLMNHLMTTPQAPNGCSELLVTAALETVAKEGCHFVTAGMVPLAKIGNTYGFGRVSYYLMSAIYRMSLPLFRLQGRQKFWEKFEPDYEPRYMLLCERHLSISHLTGLYGALN